MTVAAADAPDTLTLDELRDSANDFAPFLEQVVWGTEGARYRLEELAATLTHLPHPTFLTLRKHHRIVALRLILEKTLRLGPQTLPSFYHSFFSVDPAETKRGYGRRLAEVTLQTYLPKLGDKGIIYSHVEVENERSARIHEWLDYKTIGRFSVLSFSRLFPSPNPNIRRLTTQQIPAALTALQEQYKGHAWTDFATSMDGDNFYVLSEGSRLIAGVQVLRQRWTILDLGGFGGTVALKALPHIPILRGVFNPQDFRFLKFGNIFFAPGHADDAYALWEGVLAMHGLKTAMLFMDPTSPVTKAIREAGSLGFLNALTETPVNIYAMFRGFSNGEIEALARQPKCISPLDL